MMKKLALAAALALAAVPALAQDMFAPKTVIPAGIPMADGRKLAADIVIGYDTDEVIARYADGTTERLAVLRCGLPGTNKAMPLLFKRGQPKSCPPDLVPLN